MRPEYWMLRWRFEYLHGVIKYGQWDRHGDFEQDQAWRQSKTDLLYACIEGKEVHTKELKILHRCLGRDFVNFNWIATASVPAMMKGSVTPTPRIVGLMLVDRNDNHQVFKHGGKKSVKHNIDYGQQHLEGFGR